MSIASADLHKAVNTVWDNYGADSRFKASWVLADRTKFNSLCDQEAPPGQPFPYCVFEQSPASVVTRMSGHGSVERHEVRDIPWSFHVHSKQIDGNALTAKELAADLAEYIIQIIGGHPTIPPQDLVLDNGNVLLTQYQSDHGIYTGDEEYLWSLNYIIRVDVPVAA